MLTYIKTETAQLIVEKLPVRVNYRGGDTLHCIRAKPSTADS